MNDDHDDDGDGYGVCLQIREEWDRERGELVDGSSRKRFGEGPADISEREREREIGGRLVFDSMVSLLSLLFLFYYFFTHKVIITYIHESYIL